MLFFDSVIQYRQPLFSLVDADWAYSNRHQSGVYGARTQAKTFDAIDALPPINIHYRDTVREVRQGNYEYKHAPLALVGLTDPSRGGFITLGPTLSATSVENRTSPIRRGAWVMERILGKRFEPPKDVPDLEDSRKKAKNQKLNLTPNEVLRLHSSQEGCASCHQYIDPIGFGLEVYDQLGIKRKAAAAPSGGQKQTWDPSQTPKAFADQSWTLSEPLIPGSAYRVVFQWTRGAHRLDVKNARLESGSVKLSDPHFGFTGSKNQNNVWSFQVPKDAPKSGWRLIAEVKGDGGSDSHGTIMIAGPNDQGPRWKMPNGKSFSSPAELKKLLLADYREQITDNAVRRVLAYALGRRILPIDRPAIRRIKESLPANDYRLTALIEAVALSYPFRHKEHE
ncbi:MAG: DUF1588 domain-containing protein [Planctomycetales bacterium]